METKAPWRAKAIAIHSEKYYSELNFYSQNIDKAEEDIANYALRDNLRDVATLRGEFSILAGCSRTHVSLV